MCVVWNVTRRDNLNIITKHKPNFDKTHHFRQFLWQGRNNCHNRKTSMWSIFAKIIENYRKIPIFGQNRPKTSHFWIKTCNFADQKVVFGTQCAFFKIPLFWSYHIYSFLNPNFRIFEKFNEIFEWFWSFVWCFGISITNYFIEHAIIMTRHASIHVKDTPAKISSVIA